jgi:hypothetical protein
MSNVIPLLRNPPIAMAPYDRFTISRRKMLADWLEVCQSDLAPEHMREEIRSTLSGMVQLFELFDADRV